MLKIVLAIVLAISLLSLLFIVFSRRLGFAWLSRLGIHIVVAALGLYIINYSGWIAEAYIPLNPVTLTTVLILGLPGIGLLLGLKLILI